MEVELSLYSTFDQSIKFVFRQPSFEVVFLGVLNDLAAENGPLDMKRPKLATKSLSTFGVWEDDCAVCNSVHVARWIGCLQWHHTSR